MEQHKQKLVNTFLRDAYRVCDEELGSTLTHKDWFKSIEENSGDWNELSRDPDYVKYMNSLTRGF